MRSAAPTRPTLADPAQIAPAAVCGRNAPEALMASSPLSRLDAVTPLCR